MTRNFTNLLLSEPLPYERSDDERRRPDWQKNDRRKTWPWVVDINDRRSGLDRRLENRHAAPNSPSSIPSPM